MQIESEETCQKAIPSIQVDSGDREVLKGHNPQDLVTTECVGGESGCFYQ